MHAGGLTHTNDREALHLRFTTPTMSTADQFLETSDHSLIATDQDNQHDADCSSLCCVFAGDCAGTAIGWPNLGIAVGIVLGLFYEALQRIPE